MPISPVCIEPAATDETKAVAAKIPGNPSGLIILLGDASPDLNPLIKALWSRAIVPAAVASDARVLDNGVNSGLAALAGLAVRNAEERPALIGIARHSDEIEPNHTTAVLLPADWPDEPVKAILQFARELVKSPDGDKPVVVILARGGEAEKASLVTCARRRWPILAIEGTGGVADQLLAALKPGPDGRINSSADPDIREIVETGNINTLSLTGNIDDLNRLLLARIDLRVDTLTDAWNRYDTLDQAAIVKRRLFRNVQKAALGLGVAATFLAIVSSPGALNPVRPFLPAVLVPLLPRIKSFAHFLMVVTPITISILVAANSRFREGNKWILLRAAAEAMKREIFRYRMQSGSYCDAQCGQISREAKLATELKTISANLVQSEVNRMSLPLVSRKDPARLRFLNPDGYLKERVDDQIAHFVWKTCELYKEMKRYQVGIYVVGGFGTLLAAFNGDVWVALTTSIAAVLTTRLEMDQVENTLTQYNQALTGLRNITSWWKALTQWEKARPSNIDLLVDQTEKTLEGELAGWVQQMQSALDKLTEKDSAQQKEKARAASA
jgi:hypothetical protein